MLRELKGTSATVHGRRRARRRSLAVTVTIVILVLLPILMSAGLWYVWYSGQHTSVNVEENKSIAASKPVAPPVQADNTPVGVAQSMFTSPVVAGANSSITVRTKQKAACTITVTYGTDESLDTGLVPRTADEYGVVTWSWKVESNRAAGSYPVDIVCAKDGKSGYYRATLVVTK